MEIQELSVYKETLKIDADVMAHNILYALMSPPLEEEYPDFVVIEKPSTTNGFTIGVGDYFLHLQYDIQTEQKKASFTCKIGKLSELERIGKTIPRLGFRIIRHSLTAQTLHFDELGTTLENSSDEAAFINYWIGRLKEYLKQKNISTNF